MYVVAGPAGSGKSTAFPGEYFLCDYFNSDQYAAELNGGSFIGISRSVRTAVAAICEDFIESHIERRIDFATETTLRSPVVFEQISKAHRNGFFVSMIYICVEDLGISVKRIRQRAFLGGHSGSEETIAQIRASSLENLTTTLRLCGRAIDHLQLYDNSAHDTQPKLIAEIEAGVLAPVRSTLPKWAGQALHSSGYGPELI
jgi:predicted ABC-type ATPase